MLKIKPDQLLVAERFKVIPKEFAEQLVIEYNNGKSLNSIAKENNYSLGFLRGLFIQMGVLIRNGSKHTFEITFHGVKFKQSIIDNGEEIIKQFNLGKSKKEMAIMFNCHEDTIQRFINLIILKK